MLLTLETATLENGSYTWRFPSMRFTMCIQTYNVGIPISYSFMYDKDKQVSQLIIPPVFYPFTFDFEIDYFTIYFVGQTKTILVPTELTIELTPI